MLCWTVRPSDRVSREQRLDVLGRTFAGMRDDLGGELLELLVLSHEIGLAGKLDHRALSGSDQPIVRLSLASARSIALPRPFCELLDCL